MKRKEERGRSAGTRQALVQAAMRLFGERGYDGSSIRAIAAEAGTNSASIDYHFGGKDGLRRACAEAVAGRLGAVILPVLEAAGDSPDAATAQRTIETIVANMARFVLTTSETDNFLPFMLREIAQPGEVFDIVWSGVFLPVHKHVCRLWAAATGGEAESEETRLAVFAMIGQLIYFRIGREVVLRRMDWPAIGEAEAERINRIVRTNIDAAIAARRKATS